MVELIAHRAGNSIDAIAAAAAVADTIEVDVHLRRGRLEVRHAKVIWPTKVQWERWWIDRRPPEPPSLNDVLGRIPDDTAVWLDLKGFTTRLTNAVLRDMPPGRTITMSSRSWWTLAPARTRGVPTRRSIGSRWQLWWALRIRRWSPTDGVVVNERFLSTRRLRHLLGSTPAVHSWGVDDLPRARELIDAGVSGLILDDLHLVAEIRQDRQR